MLFPSFTRQRKGHATAPARPRVHPSIVSAIETLECRQLLSAQLTVTNTQNADTPKTIDFGDVALNTFSTTETFTLSNPGDATLHVSAFTLNDPADDLFVKDDNGDDLAAPFTVPANGTFHINIVFDPTPVGSRSQTLTLVTDGSDAGDDSVVLHTMGTGVAPATPSAPTGLFANAVDSGHIQLAWHDNANNETGFHIYQSTNQNTGFALIKTAAAGTQSFLAGGLSPGVTYFYRVTAFNNGGDSANTADFDVTPASTDKAGNTIAKAKNLGTFVNTKSISDFVGDADTKDFYKIIVTKKGVLHLRLSNLSGDADLEFLNAKGTKIGSSENSDTTEERINKAVIPGTYFAEVVQGNSGVNAAYTFSATNDTVGNTVKAAANLGTFSKKLVLSDSVGIGDASDFYKIVLKTRHALALTLNGLTDDNDLELLNIHGKNIGSSENSDATAESIKKTLAAGTYYIQVTQGSPDSGSNYKLTIA